ncbi:MAG: hypothetical protein AAGK14_14175 [Verrucomicrobiota bacterium]
MPTPLEILRRRSRLIACLILAALLAGTGQLGLGALQVTAWSAMVVGYTQQTGSVSEALSKTFDGQHPCPLCREVRELASEQQPDPERAENERKHQPIALAGAAEIVISRPDGTALEAEIPAMSTRVSPHPLPPPRA